MGLLSVGANIKPMQIQTYNTRIDIDTESGDIMDDIDESKETQTEVSGDIGILFQEKNTDINFALVAKNITSPEIDLKGSDESIELAAGYRAGASYRMLGDSLELAFDADLNEQDTLFEGMKTQYIGGGVEFHPSSWFALRGGAMKNIASNSFDEGLIYSGGLNFGTKWFQADLSAMVSQKSGEYDGSDIPRYANVNFSLISRW